MTRRVRAADPLRARRGARRRGRGARDRVRGAGRGGPFVNLFDFASRVDARKIDESVLEALVQCGAFDSTLAAQGVTRAVAFASIDIALDRSRAASRDREAGQTNLLGLFDAAPRPAAAEGKKASGIEPGRLRPRAPWDRREMLVREKQSLGFYVSGHPLDRYPEGGGALARLEVKAVAECATWPTGRWSSSRGWSRVIARRCGRMRREVRVLRARGSVRSGQREAAGRARSTRTREVLSKGDPVVISGKVSFPRRDEDAARATRCPRRHARRPS